MKKGQWEEYRTLKQHGWELTRENSIQWNGGSETEKHIHTKLAVGHVAKQAGYRIDSETTHEGHRGEIDVLIYGHPTRLTYAVEIEHSPTQEVLDDKRARYVDGTPIDDMLPVNANECPMDIPELHAHVREVLGLGDSA